MDAATKNAIRGVILAALELGITQAIDASLGALLLGDLDGIELYVSFFSTADADEAAARPTGVTLRGPKALPVRIAGA